MVANLSMTDFAFGRQDGAAGGEGDVALELHHAAGGVELDHAGVGVGEVGQRVGQRSGQRMPTPPACMICSIFGGFFRLS